MRGGPIGHRITSTTFKKRGPHQGCLIATGRKLQLPHLLSMLVFKSFDIISSGRYPRIAGLTGSPDDPPTPQNHKPPHKPPQRRGPMHSVLVGRSKTCSSTGAVTSTWSEKNSDSHPDFGTGDRTNDEPQSSGEESRREHPVPGGGGGGVGRGGGGVGVPPTLGF